MAELARPNTLSIGFARLLILRKEVQRVAAVGELCGAFGARSGAYERTVDPLTQRPAACHSPPVAWLVARTPDGAALAYPPDGPPSRPIRARHRWRPAALSTRAMATST
jgi:hypothetical protein